MNEQEIERTRVFPAQAERVESGPIQFGKDWPGVFMRGDHALPSAMFLNSVFEMIERGEDPRADAMTYHQAKSIVALLASCDTRNHLQSQERDAA